MKYAFLGIYAALLIVIAIYSIRRSKTTEDFFLGGRKMGAWMSAFAYGTTYFSAVIFIGYAGRFGWNFGIWSVLIGLGNAFIGSFLAWQILAKRTRAMTQRLNAATMPEFLEKRYKSKGLKIAGALAIFIFLVPYCASVYQGLGLIFTSVFGIDYLWCMGGMALLTAIYLAAGGYFATALTDFIQGIVMLGGVLLMVIFIVSNPIVGGLGEGLSKLGAISPKLLDISQNPGFMNLIWVFLLTSVGVWGMPQMVHKYYAIKDKPAIVRGTVITTVFALIIAGGAYFSGVFGPIYLNNTMPKGGNDAIMPTMLQTALPEWMLGLIIILVLAASMSTLSSLVLVSSGAISMDLGKGVIKKNMKQKSVVLLMRLLCILFAGLSLLVAAFQVAEILTLMSFSWGAIAGAFLGPYIYGLFWKKTTKAGAWAGFITGIAVTIGLALFFGFTGGVDAAKAQAPFIGVMAMAGSVVIVPIVTAFSLKFKYSKEHIDNAFGVKEEPA